MARGTSQQPRTDHGRLSRAFGLLRRAGLLAIALLGLGLTGNAYAIDCSELPNGVLDGDTGAVPPSQIFVDRHCTIRNFPAGNELNTNFSFYTSPGQNDERWVIIFDNVVHTGQMACNSVAGHKIWFTNGSSTSIQEGCQNYLIPVEKIDKQNPAGQTSAAIGVPFTYRLTMPVLFDPATGTTINTAGSVNTLHGVTLTDDLNETGVDLQYVSHSAYWLHNGNPVPHTFDNTGGLLTFDNFPIVPAGDQIVLEITVVLLDTPGNVIGTSFINTARWDFGRLIDGEFFEPLPGEWGISEPMTIGGPNLQLTKTGPATLNFGQLGNFVLDIRNAGSTDAWEADIVDRLPADMCDAAPQITSAQVFAADGTSPVPGKGPLAPGTDYNLSFNSGTCEVQIDLLTANATVGGGERLIITYDARLDADAANGAALTNVAGITEWHNDAAGNPDRISFNRSVTNGTPGVLDHQDNHQLLVDITGYFFEKTVQNLTSGANPAATATPGDMLRYTLTLRTTDSALNDFTFYDDLTTLNAAGVFAPSSLQLVGSTIPGGADTSGTNPAAGIVSVGNLSVPANDSLSISFDVELTGSIANGTLIRNQSQLQSVTANLVSDDPNVNGVADPNLAGDEDITTVTITSAPLLQVEKTSTYLDGDPTVLMAGERLRYTITVRNIGTEDTADAQLRDQIPVNTTYIVGSTTMNGANVADINSTSALVTGIALRAPNSTSDGQVPADATAAPGNSVTIEFDVQTSAGLLDGTVISNQAFVDAPSSGVSNMPSDDPDTPIADDPTRDPIGNVPLLFAEKSAVLWVDNSTPGTIDPGDTLRYTITIYNTGAAAATNAVLQDGVPGNTTYVAGSTLMNGEPVADPGGSFPLQPGLAVSSDDLTPPLPLPGDGNISVGSFAQVTFDVVIDAGTPSGTAISNQAQVTTTEIPLTLTDGDGNPATGPEPTIVIVGDIARLSILKQVTVVGGGAAEAGSTLQYDVQISNVGNVPAYNVMVTDDLDDVIAGQLTYVTGSATVNGATTGVSVAGNVITFDYNALGALLQPGEGFTLRLQATIGAQIPIGTAVINRAVVMWNDTETAEALASIDVGGIPGSGAINGTAWHDANFDNVLDSNERVLPNWRVELYRNNTLLISTQTAADGTYSFAGLPPNYLTGDSYYLLFIAPGGGPNTAMLGEAYSPNFTNGPQEIRDIVLQEGDNHTNLDMPIEPNGVVYNALSRTPLGSVTLTLLGPDGSPVSNTCLEDPNQQNQVTSLQGHYKFDLTFGDISCPSGATYTIELTVPGSGFVAGYSQLIPPSSTASRPFNVPNCPGTANDAVPATGAHCEIQPFVDAPSPFVLAQSAGTSYQVHLTINDSDLPGSNQLYNNHIPVDPVLDGTVIVTKSTPMVNVSRGQLIPYVITIRNTYEIDLVDIDLVDAFPAGFQYIEGSARYDGIEAQPTRLGRTLVFEALTLGAEQTHTIQLLLGVGSGVSEGEFVNRAFAQHGVSGVMLSNQATATVRLVPDPDFDCTDVIGKVFDDGNRNGIQDNDEDGLGGVRVVTATGLAATTDTHGRFHFTCPIVPNEQRGSNFVLKLDDRTLPSGYRASTDMLKVQRATRGKALKFSFGASIHRVVGLDVADALFYPDTTDIRPQWLPRFSLLIEEMQKAPSLLRLSYLADLESEQLVEQRMEVLQQHVQRAWQDAQCCEQLIIEPEVFWRLGKPADRTLQAQRRNAQ